MSLIKECTAKFETVLITLDLYYDWILGESLLVGKLNLIMM